MSTESPKLQLDDAVTLWIAIALFLSFSILILLIQQLFHVKIIRQNLSCTIMAWMFMY